MVQILFRVSLLLGGLISTALVAQGLPTKSSQSDVPERVTICQLKSDPAKYNHKLIEVTGFISHGFEDFGLFDPMCEAKGNIWLDYGGTKASDTMYCCGVAPSHTIPQNVSVDGKTIPLVHNDPFTTF